MDCKTIELIIYTVAAGIHIFGIENINYMVVIIFVSQSIIIKMKLQYLRST